MMPTSRALRLILVVLAVVPIFGKARAREDGADFDISKASRYQRSDSNIYYRPDILKANPGAVIIPKSDYQQQGDNYFFVPKIKAPKTLQFEIYNDWIEPITPPDAPHTLSIPPDQMQIREPQGDVQVALPSAPGTFAPVNDGMVVPNGAVVKTGANGTVAVLIGGVDSTRLMPNSAAAVQQTVTGTTRAVEVNLTAGGVFSKVGQQIGVKGEYRVHTPNGTAVAHGTDFVTMITANRTDVWIEEGTVSLDTPGNGPALSATADGSGPLKHLQFPPINDAKKLMAADAEALTAIFNFIPMANQKIAALRAKSTRGEVLTSGQMDYLNRIKQVPGLIKLAIVEKTPAPIAVTQPVPAPLAAPAVNMREPAAEGSPTIAAPAVPATPATPPAPAITLGPNDAISFTNGTAPGPVDDAALRKGLADIAAANPKQLVVIQETSKVSPAVVKKVIAACHAVKLKAKIVKYKAPAVSPPAVVEAPPPATPPPPPAAEGVGGTSPTTEKPAPKARPVTPPGPVTVQVHPNGTIGIQGKRLTLLQFQVHLKALIKAKPETELVIKSGKEVPYAHLKEVLDSCADAHVQHLTVTSPSPAPPLPSSSPSTNAPSGGENNLPTPGLLMHPTMQPVLTAPPPPPTNAAPSTNAP